MNQLLYACLVLLPFGIVLRMSLRLLYGARGPQVGDPIYQVVYTASWGLTIIPLLAFLVVGTSWLSWFVLIVTAFAGVELVLARRAMQRRAAWELLTRSLGLQEPDVQALQNHEGRFTGIVGRAFRNLVTSLRQGVDLRQAIGEHRRALPKEAQAFAAIDALAVADSSVGKSADALGYTQDANQTMAASVQQLGQRYAYLSTVVLVMAFMLSFFMIKIIPSYQAIFEDFALDLPGITQFLIFLSSGFLNTPIAFLLFCVLLLTLIGGISIGVLYLCDVDALRPIVDRLFFTRHRSQILHLLAIAAERGQPFSSVLQSLVEGKLRYPSRVAVRRLRRAHRQLSAGSDWKFALLDASIIKSADIPMLETAQQAGNLPWVLRLLADQKSRRMLFRWTAFEKIVFPLQVILLGAVVMFICVALFVPLVELINGMTG